MALYGQSHINPAFTYTRSIGNRFNSRDRGAWYMLTSTQEVGFHRTRELEFIGHFEDAVYYVELLADFIGNFPDLHGEQHPSLDADPDVGYPAGQALATELRQEGGKCFVAFDPGIIQNVRPGATWRLVWHGLPEFAIEGR